METRENFQASIENTELTYCVFKIMRCRVECHIEEVVEGCEGYPWEQVLEEVVRLSKRGDLRVVYKEGGDYAIRLCPRC